jgi:EmrB/QacA subfamily drug resistance transporter
VLIAARAVQGLGGAIVTPLTLTILSAAVPAERRGLVLGAWGGISGLAVAIGPLVGGAVVQGISWQWIFWLNVPIGLALIPLAYLRLRETRGPNDALDLPGVALASAGLFGIVWGLVRGNGVGWGSLEITTSFVLGTIVLALFVVWELRAPAPMLPLRFFRNRTFTAANAASFLMFFGMFGSIFLLAQFFQTVQGYSPLQAGLRVLPWTAMPIFVAPIAGALSDRIGGRPLMATGLALQAIGLAWIAFVSTPTVAYSELVTPFVLSGIGMALYFAPVANVVLSAVRPIEEGQASGATTRSASSAASSASRCWRRYSRTTAATRPARRSSTASRRRSTSAPCSSPRAPSPRWASSANGSPRSRRQLSRRSKRPSGLEARSRRAGRASYLRGRRSPPGGSRPPPS